MKTDRKIELVTLIHEGYLKYKDNTRIQTLFKLIPVENNDKMAYLLINPDLIIKGARTSIQQRMGYDVNKADTEAFVKILSKKYKTVANLINYCNTTAKTLHTVIIKEMGEYLKANCRTNMSLFDYYNKFKFDRELTKYHGYYSIEINLKDSISGKIKIDNCRVGFGYAKYLIQIKSFDDNNNIYIRTEEEETLKQMKVYYYDDDRKQQ